MAASLNLARRIERPSRRPIVLPQIRATQAQAGELSALYSRVVTPWREGVDRIIAAYERTLAEAQLDSATDISSAMDDIEAEVRRIVVLLTPDLRNWALRTEKVHRGKWVRNILSATQVNLETILSADDVDETLEEVIEWNVGLIRDVNSEARRRISNAVFAGLQQRKPAREVARDIREATGMARARSIRIASDQTVKLGERLNRARQQQAGLTHFKWRHSGKKHPREHHKARDGKVFPWDDSEIPADDMPGVPPNCGCTAQGVVIFGDDGS